MQIYLMISPHNSAHKGYWFNNDSDGFPIFQRLYIDGLIQKKHNFIANA